MIGLRVEGLAHVYSAGAVRALDGVDLEIRPGELMALVGQNGSGKSTLVRHLNGLLRPTEGRVWVDGVDAAGRTVAQLARLVGSVFQDPDRQIFAGSVRAEVEFGPRNLGLTGAQLRAAVAEALAAVGLDGKEDANPFDLGATRRKLLALASVLAVGTQVLIMDEPTAQLDPAGTRLVADALARLAANGASILIAEQKTDLLAALCSRIIVLQAGRVIRDGPTVEVLTDPQLPRHGVPETSAGRFRRLVTEAGIAEKLLDRALD
ncbi:N/A [soil metagenome]